MFQPTQGSLILGRYLLERELARGGMSSVWLAADMKLQRSVAVKLLGTTRSVSPDACNRFEREARAVAQLQSPHVVQIFDYGVEHGSPIIVMERLYGEDLRTRLKREQRLPLASVALIVVETAKGLSEAHAAGIVHRDLKPGNIFFARSRQDEVVKLLDFGVAKAMSGSAIGEGPASLGGLVGTPHFMSPEQARGSEDIDHRSDLWSLGVIIYNAITGRLPYGGSSTADVLTKICAERFAVPSAVCRDLPKEIDQFMLQALARDPEQRFGSAREMASAFARIVPVSTPAIEHAEPHGIEDEATAEFDPAQELEIAGLPRPPPLPAEFARIPSDLPSFPTHPTHPSTLGSAMLDGSVRPVSPHRKLVVWSLAAMVVAALAASAAVVAWRPADAPQPSSATSESPSPAAAPAEPAEEPESTEQSSSEPEPEPTEKPEPAQPKTAAAPPPFPRPAAAPPPFKPPPAPVAKPPPADKTPEPASTDDWSTSRF